MLRLLLDRITLALRTWPDGLAWRDCGLLLLGFALLAIPLGYYGGLFKFQRADMSAAQLATFALVTFFLPSLFEEVLFRGLLLPHAAETASRQAMWLQASIAWALFVAVHPLNAWLLRPSAREVFYDPVFLAVAGLLGIACTLAYLRSGSLWPAVAMHWLAVVLWKVALGGPKPIFRV